MKSSADNAETTELDSLSIACSSCHCNSSSDDYLGYHLPFGGLNITTYKIIMSQSISQDGWLMPVRKNAED
jgi:hypothetical protein